MANGKEKMIMLLTNPWLYSKALQSVLPNLFLHISFHYKFNKLAHQNSAVYDQLKLMCFGEDTTCMAVLIAGACQVSCISSGLINLSGSMHKHMSGHT